MGDINTLGKIVNIEVGSIFYHWRYGEMTVIDVKEQWIILNINDFKSIKVDEKLIDPWERHFKENPKKFMKTAIEKWLFKVPERVGVSNPAYGDKEFISDEVFLRKLNLSYNKELVMECKNNYIAYFAKQKSEGLNKKEDIDGNSSDIHRKEIDKLAKDKEMYGLNRERKEEELKGITNKLLDCDLEIFALEDNIVKLKKKIIEKEKKIVIKENELDRLESDNNSSTYSKIQGQIMDIEGEIRRLEEGIDEIKNDINEGIRRIDKISREQKSIENKKGLLNKEIIDLNKKITKIEKNLETCK